MLPRKAHILLIEDSSADAELLKQAVYKHEQEIVLHHVPDVIGAFSYLAKKGRFTAAPDPDVLLLDLSLPHIPGIEALRIIKETEIWKNIPVVVLTGLEDRRERQRCLELGATAIWEKPPTWDEYVHLVDIIRDCLKDHDKPVECLEEHSAEL